MLRRNIMCEDDLVNGARGEIMGFKWSNGGDHQDQAGMLPAAVLVKFHDPRVGRISVPVLVVIWKLLKLDPYLLNSMLSKV